MRLTGPGRSSDRSPTGRVVAVWCSDEHDAVRTAQAAACALGVRRTERAGLIVRDGDDRGAIVSCFRAVLPVVAGNLGADHTRGNGLDAGDVGELAGDSDGWMCRSWAGHRFG